MPVNALFGTASPGISKSFTSLSKKASPLSCRFCLMAYQILKPGSDSNLALVFSASAVCQIGSAGDGKSARRQRAGLGLR